MTRRSLRFRLSVASATSIAVVLIIAGVGLTVLFARHVERRISAELDTYLNQIVANVEWTNDGRARFAQELADPRFRQPLSGLYWQIQDDERSVLLRSRSLWDDFIRLPADELTPGIVHQHALQGPSGQSLLVRERQIVFRPNSEQRRLRIALAIEQRYLLAARDAFVVDMVPYLLVIATVLLLAAWLQIRAGLAPLDAVRHGVASIRTGQQRRLSRDYPDEVMPLVDEMNGVLEAQESAIDRAKSWTADLAHGLKTPLMVLTADSQRLRDQGMTAIADDLDQLADTMRRRVDRELIRARIRSRIDTKQARADTGDVIERLVRTLRRTPAGEALHWNVQTAQGAFASVSSDDLTELLGNLLENATKWADQAVSVSVSKNEKISIRIEDDGPGVQHDQLDSLGLRGLRLDEQKQGSGLGLAIVSDIVEAYGGELFFDRSPMGGLSVWVRMPAFN